MNPEPLIGVLADDGFEDGVEALGIDGRVAGDLKRRVEAEDVATLPFRPEGEAGDDGGAGAGGEFDEGGVGAGLEAEEIDEDAFGEGGVLIDENTDGFVRLQGTEDGAGGFFLFDEEVAGEAAAALDERVDAGVVERADDDVHRLGHEGVRERAQFPIAEMGGGEEDALACGFSALEVFEAFIANPLRDVGTVDLREAGEGDEEAGDGGEDAIGDGRALVGRIAGEGEIAQGDAAESREGVIEKRCVKAG